MPRVVPPLEAKLPDALSPSFIETTAGFTAGVVSTLVVHPFDVLKTRLQLDPSAQRSQWGTSARMFRAIIRDEGSYAALYRGLTPNLIGNSVSWGLYFLWYRNLKDSIQSYRGPERGLTSLDYLFASGTAGTLTALLTNPIWVLKTRMLSSGAHAPGAYTSLSHGLRTILRTEGVKGLYRGLIPGLFGISHGAVQFMAYEELKNHRRKVKERHGSEGKGELSNWDFLSLSAASKIFAGSVTYPYQVLRARLQMYDAGERYKGVVDVAQQVWRREGIGGFYKGLVPNIVRVLPSTCVTFLVYENVKWYLPRSYRTGEAGI